MNLQTRMAFIRRQTGNVVPTDATSERILPELPRAVLAAFNRRYYEHSNKPVSNSQVEAMALALADVTGWPIDMAAFESEGLL